MTTQGTCQGYGQLVRQVRDSEAYGCPVCGKVFGTNYQQFARSVIIPEHADNREQPLDEERVRRLFAR